MNSKLSMKTKGGTKCSVSYNDFVVLLSIQASGMTMVSNATTSELVLPSGVTPVVGNLFIMVNVMTAAWIPSGINAYIHFPNGSRQPTIRFTSGQSITNAVILGTFAFPRSWFYIT